MPTPASVFDDNMDVWTAEQQTPWSRLKYTVVRSNLGRHLPSRRLRILDAGGGNGHDSLPFASEGHHVTIVDYADAMLGDAKKSAAGLRLEESLTTHRAELSDLPTLFPEPCFDVVFCHNVLQYVDDVPGLLAAVAAPLKAGGLLSILSVNRYAIPYRAAFFRGDLADAYTRLDARSELATLFGTPMTQYSANEIAALLPVTGCVVIEDYGVRCICDYWGDNQRKSDPAVFADLECLELALTDRHPYKLLARYFQVIACKQLE